jgi:hypothetical protein
LERNVDAATSIPSKVETRRKPTDEELAHVVEIMLKLDPENSEPRPFLTFFNVYIHGCYHADKYCRYC